jgi:NhaP-type Na+/H+ or K+/H+ antiporter
MGGYCIYSLHFQCLYHFSSLRLSHNIIRHHVQTCFWQCFVLAVPGVVVSTALTACFARLVLPAWGWKLCFVFGSIVSATDPVAVVAILKSAGASPKLTTLIIGESLMNDGTAMIFFSLFFGMLDGKTYSGNDVLFFFFKMLIGE